MKTVFLDEGEEKGKDPRWKHFHGTLAGWGRHFLINATTIFFSLSQGSQKRGEYEDNE